MKIQKFVYGGVYSGSTIPPTQLPTRKVSGGRSDSESTPLKDSILKMLDNAGLPSDNGYIGDYIQQVLDAAGSGDIDSTSFGQLSKMLLNAKSEQANWNEARKHAQEHNTLSDIAVSTDGEIWVQDENGNVKKVTTNELYNDSNESNYRFLTNSGILEYRYKYDYFNDEIINDVSTSVNSYDIGKKIRELINDIPDTETSAYFNKNGQLSSIMKGAQLAMGEGIKGIYEVTSNTDIPKDINNFVSWVWNYGLGQNERNYITAKIATSGGDPKLFNNKVEFILDAVQAFTHYDVDPAYQKEMSDDLYMHGSGSKSDSSVIELTLAHSYAHGNNANPEILAISPKDSQTSLRITGYNVGPIAEANGQNRFGVATFNNVVNNAYGIGTMMDGLGSKIAFGDHIIDRKDWNAIVCTENNMYRGRLPYTKTDSGDIIPDFRVLNKLDELAEKLDNNEITVDSLKTYLYNNMPGVIYKEETGEFDFLESASKIFLIANAVVGAGYIKDFNPTDYESYITKDDNFMKSVYKDVLAHGDLKTGSKEQRDQASKWWFSGIDPYRGNIFIPIDPTAADRVFLPDYVLKSQHTNTAGRYRESQREIELKQRKDNGMLDFNWE